MAKSLLGEDCVKDFLKGIQVSYPGLCVDVDSQVVFINKNRGNNVAVISGGGSGHEPFGAGFVADNMLTGVVCGAVFASPPSKMIFNAMSNLVDKNKGGILVLIMNYTGDKLNFGMAIERLKQKGFPVESVLVSDDCVDLLKEKSNSVGRRGCCGISLISKIIGNMSANGFNLLSLKKEAEEINSRMFTLSAALQPCTLPGNEAPLWHLESEEVEIGVGVHGEKGMKTIKLKSLNDLVKTLLNYISEFIKINSNYVLMINNLGICSDLEMYSVAHKVDDEIKKWKIQIKRFYVGKLMSSLDMKGVQLTFFDITGKEGWLDHLDVDTEAFGWPFKALNCAPFTNFQFNSMDEQNKFKSSLILNKKDALIFKEVLLATCEAIEQNETSINNLDGKCGDGDCGSCLKRLAVGIKEKIDLLPLEDISQTMCSLSDIAETTMGGTSGALYSLMFIGAAKGHDWPSVWREAINMIQMYSDAKIGDRTMMDAFIPACDEFIKHFKPGYGLEALKYAVEKSQEGCALTSSMTPRIGRASYVDRALIQGLDAGAFGVVIWLNAILNCLQ